MHRMSFKLLIPTGLLASLMMLNPVARAVGLGPVEVDSGLNQPLRAEIPLLSVGGMDLDGVEVGLASPEDFARVGIDRPAVLERLHFTLETSAGRPVILVTSDQPVTEPFLSFLVRVSWPQGRLLREYTVLLDPPVTAPAAAAAPEQARERRVEREASEAADTAAGPETAATRPQAPSRGADEGDAPRTAGGGQYGPVAGGETLWSIANRTRPDDSVSVNQMMLALLRTNPDAFFRDNINALRRGAVLRVPNPGEIETLTTTEALSAVRRQNELWQDYRRNLAQDAPTVVAGGEPRQRAQEPAQAGAAESRLELVPPREGEADAETVRAGAGAETGQPGREELRRELARTREELLARREQNDQLDGRVSELEAQVDRLQRLLELKNEELATMQSQDAQRGTAAEPAGPDDAGAAPEDQQDDARAGATGDTAAEGETAQPAPPAGAEAAPTPGDEQQAAEADEVEPAPVESRPPPAPAERGWMELLLSPVVLGVAGLLLIGIGVALVLHRRGSGLAEPTAQRETLGARMIRSREREETQPEATKAQTDEAAEDDFGPPEAGPADYDEAALRAALEEAPSDTDTRLKLIRHYAATHQREAFVAQAETLYAELADPAAPAWLETRQLGEELAPDHALFGGSAEDIRSTVPDAAAGDTTPEAPAPAEPQAPGSPPAPEEEVRAGEREPDADLPDLDFGSPAEDAAPAGRGESGPGEAEGAGSEDLPPGGEYELADLEGEAGAPEPGSTGEAPEEPDSRDPAEDEFDFGDVAEAREPDEREPLEFDLSDFESESEGADESGQDRTGGAPSVDMETPEESAPGAGKDAEPSAGEAPSGGDEAVDTKLELAEAYLDMGDEEGAREMLEEVMGEGGEDQKKRAREMLDKLG